jgi:rubrerythrin
MDEPELVVPTLELSIEGVIASALRSERDALRFYEEAAATIGDPVAFEALREVALEERLHFARLARVFKERFPQAWDEGTRRMHEPDAGQVEFPPLRELAKMKAPEILAIAKWEESRTRALYLAGANAAGSEMPDVSAMLLSLADDEARHFMRLTEIGASLGV